MTSLNMDYSAIHTEESPHASPWASSPQHSRTSFEPRTSGEGEPPSPIPGLSRSGTSDVRPSSDERPDESAPRFSSQAPTVTEDDHTGRPLNGEPPPQTQAENQQPYQQQQRQQQDQQPAPAQKQPRSTQRYHGQRPRSRQDGPTYKLQPRVTGLERPTRKDLMIRFDVYVRCFPRRRAVAILTRPIDEPPWLPNNSIPRRTTVAQRIRQVSGSFGISKPRSTCPSATTTSNTSRRRY